MRKQTFVAGLAAAALAIVLPVAAGARSPQEGITVHGHWVLDVRNPDGSLASHLAFENALTNSGARTVAGLLSRQYAAGSWVVVLYGGANATPPAPCVFPPNAFGIPLPPGGPCILAEAAYFGGTSVPAGLGILTMNQANGTVVLSGSVQATSAGTVGLVESHLTCPSPAGPCDQSDSLGNLFSSAVLSAPQTVAANQVIQVSVTFSFS